MRGGGRWWGQAAGLIFVMVAGGLAATFPVVGAGSDGTSAAAEVRASQFLPPAPSIAQPPLYVSVVPRGPAVRKRTRFRLRTYVYSGNRRRPVPGAVVRLGGRRATTDRAGRAFVRASFRDPGFVPVLATARGLRPAISAVKVTGMLPPGEEPGERPCISGRYAVKNLADTGVALVDPVPVPTSLTELWARRPPGGLGFFTGRLPHTERHVYQITVRLVSLQLLVDRDIHLVVAEPGHPKRTMITELPSPRCYSVAVSPYRNAMVHTRQTLTRACGGVGRRQRRIVGSATLTGVGFWDHRHGQYGVARNGIELHPLLDFHSTGCRRARP
jgi:hypothetical protein